jgi:hypothetical protein
VDCLASIGRNGLIYAQTHNQLGTQGVGGTLTCARERFPSSLKNKSLLTIALAPQSITTGGEACADQRHLIDPGKEDSAQVLSNPELSWSTCGLGGNTATICLRQVKLDLVHFVEV